VSENKEQFKDKEQIEQSHRPTSIDSGNKVQLKNKEKIEQSHRPTSIDSGDTRI